ncbi:MAG: hypothetical protein EXX96DRAFT_482960 [Benjaminiella poitrasii]|nr:MAG: hypothetical protein EXX96DRAFT_482960 [Benjaminiella poitrasii]
MLPNSRIIPPNENHKFRTRSNSAFNEGGLKKGFMSRLLTNPPIPKEYNMSSTNNQRPKYESILRDDIDDDRPKVRPIHKTNPKHPKIPLAPPPNHVPPRNRTISQPNQQHFLTNLPDQYIAKRPSTMIQKESSMNKISTPITSSASARKSSSSYSIYSTFGSGYSIDERSLLTPSPVSDDDIATTTTTTTATTTDDDDDDDFVDATGFSQEDIEKERRMMREKESQRLSKRLSGGHFGSAGGLLLSIQPSSEEERTEMPIIKRKSHKIPADDELAQSMLNWKRHSDSSKRWSMRSSVHLHYKEDDATKHLSTDTAIDLREKSVQKNTRNEEDEEELSVPDKMALRKKTEEALLGTASPNLSKTIDDVWKSSNDALHLFDDQKTKDLENSIQTQSASNQQQQQKKIQLDEQDTMEQQKITKTATSLWNEDETIIEKEKMAEFLGQGKPFNNAVLQEYMKSFIFSEMRLDSAFRKLCSKLYFKAEAQQIDRILEAFANRYWDCNPQCIFGSSDIVYAIVYSLLLLNTDLHVAQGNHPRMTRSEFIRNTMSTIREQKEHEGLLKSENNRPFSMDSRNWEAEIEFRLKEMYISVKHYQILQPLSRKTSLNKRSSILGGRRVIGLKRSVNSIIRKSGRESMFFQDNYDQVASTHHRPMTPTSIKSFRRESFSSTNSSSAASFNSQCTSPSIMSSQPMFQYMDTHDTSLFSSRPPYYKEGVVMRKHLLENATQKARHREWRECYLEVGQGELRMYALQSSSSHQGTSDKSLFRHSSTMHFNHLSDPKSRRLTNSIWASCSQLIGKIALNHTLSNPLPPPGYNRQRPHVFAIQQSDGGVYLFQVTSAEQAYEWVSTCNYWAARQSKEPLAGGVGNMEYGWGTCLDDVIIDLDAIEQGYGQNMNCYADSDSDSIVIHDWIPPSASMVSSQLNEKEQYDALQKYLVELNAEINEHRNLKIKILVKFSTKCSNYSKVMNNWEAKSKYLLHDIIKYQNYCDVLEKAFKKQEEQSIVNSSEKDQQEDVSTNYKASMTDTLSSTKLIYHSDSIDLFKEINQELNLHF